MKRSVFWSFVCCCFSPYAKNSWKKKKKSLFTFNKTISDILLDILQKIKSTIEKQTTNLMQTIPISPGRGGARLHAICILNSAVDIVSNRNSSGKAFHSRAMAKSRQRSPSWDVHVCNTKYTLYYPTPSLLPVGLNDTKGKCTGAYSSENHTDSFRTLLVHCILNLIITYMYMY